MSIQILSKEPIALAQINKLLKSTKKEERADIQNKILDYSKKASRISETDCTKMIEELKALNIPGFTDEIAISLANIMPETMTEIKSIMAGKSNINPESFKKIQEVITKYLKEK